MDSPARPPGGPEQRAAAGREARSRAPRRALGAWDPGVRAHDPVALVLAESATRLPGLPPLRHARMAASPWHFYRGSAEVAAADLAAGPSTGLRVQLCGDAHVLNFGLWATPERQLAFDARDFDETLPGPFEWDVKRLVASLVLAARASGRPGLAGAAVAAATRTYRARLAALARAHELDVWYDITRVDELVDSFVDPARQEQVSAYVARRAGRRTSRGAFARLTATEGGRTRIVDDPPLRVHLDDAEHAHVLAVLASYRASLEESVAFLLDRFAVVDAVRQVVGVGSVGMRVYLVLLGGRGGDDPLFLQVKQATASVYEPYAGASAYPGHGRRVVVGKRLVQGATDIFVGHAQADGVHYYVRQFRDMKVVPDARRIGPILTDLAGATGSVLARAHARTGDAVAISAYVGRGEAFADGMARWAAAYADQTESDHAAFAAAVARGDVEAAERGW